MSAVPGATVTPAGPAAPAAAATAATPAAPAAGAPAATDAAQAPAATATEATIDLTTLDPAVAAEITKWKALSRKNEDQAKANADKAKQFDAIEEGKKTDLQKAQDELARVQAELAAAVGGSLKADVAAAKGVPAALLIGETKEELEAYADGLLAFKGVTPPPAQDAAASAAGGTPIGTAGDQLTREQLKGMTTKEIQEARAAGRLDKLMGKQQ